MRRIIRYILWMVTLLFVALFLLSSVAGVVSPSVFVLPSILSYLCFPLFLVVLLSLLFWLFVKRWLYAAICGAVLLLRFSVIPLFFQMGGNKQPEYLDEDNLKVMSYNVYRLRGTRKCPKEEVPCSLNELIYAEQPDLLCVQEAGSRGVLEKVLAQQKFKYVHCGTAGTVLFSRYPILQTGNMGGYGKFWADVAYCNRCVRIICVHFDSYQFSDNDLDALLDLSHGQADKQRSAGLINKMKRTILEHEEEWHRDILPAIEGFDGPIVVVGDFNDTPASYLYHQMSEVLSDSYCKQGSGFSTTYNGPFPAYRIDYIFASSKLKATSYRRIKSPISDHYPIVATFSIAE